MPRNASAPTSSPRTFVGLNKGHDAGVCLLPDGGPIEQAEILLEERLARVKHADSPLVHALFAVPGTIPISNERIAENFVAFDPCDAERLLNEHMPYFDTLKRLGFASFTRHFNPKLRSFTHHYCHARAAAALSPFARSLIVVHDSAGNRWLDFSPDHEETRFPPPPPSSLSGNAREFYTVYRQRGARLACVEKKWMPSDAVIRAGVLPSMAGSGMKTNANDLSLGVFFTQASRYIFNSHWSEGKVMGLAAFGRPGALEIKRRGTFFQELGEEKMFRGGGKRAWEKCGFFEHYADVAAAVQDHFEQWLLGLASDLKRRFPGEENLILTGGCALNCVANMKLAQSGLFSSIYVSPFPGDESIAFGAACALRYENPDEPWRPWPWRSQAPNFGPRKSAPNEKSCRAIFSEYKVSRLADPAAAAADLLSRNKVVAWFQGRSESGPRALGFRSILANPSRPGIKDYLNEFIKGREGFRPYGCSVLREEAEKYFHVPPGFESPFMSFAPLVREAYRERLGEITHKDGTSRIQTVRKGQNPLLRRLLEEMRRNTGLGCVLNTSLNVMGEPIVETLGDLRRLLDKVPLDAAVAGNCLIEPLSESRGKAPGLSG